MTYKELYESAIDKLEKSKITLGEFEKMIEPLNAEIATANSDTISRQAALEACKGYFIVSGRINRLPPIPIQPDITHIILETLNECGIYGEEATIKLIGTLKRIGRNDLIPPCAR